MRERYPIYAEADHTVDSQVEPHEVGGRTDTGDGRALGAAGLMGEARTLRVALGERSYPIAIGAGLIERADELLAPLVPLRRTVVVTDENLARTAHPARLVAALERAGIASRSLVLPAGESTKSWSFLEQVVDEFLAFGVERRSVVVALGGGVIGDLVGFAAAVTLRGIDFIQIPTTLLAQVDSAVGGKTGINSHHGKNLIGAFHQPKAVLIDTAVLDGLPLRELRAGYAEVAKYGLIRDADGFFAWLERHGAAVLAGDPTARAEADPAIAGDQGRDRGGRRAGDERASARCSTSATPSPMPTRPWRATTAGCCTERPSPSAWSRRWRFRCGSATVRPMTWRGRGPISPPWGCRPGWRRSATGRSRPTRCWPPWPGTRRSRAPGSDSFWRAASATPSPAPTCRAKPYARYWPRMTDQPRSQGPGR